MAVTPPAFINAVSYSGETLRRDFVGLVAGGASAGTPRTGLLDVRGMQVSLSGTSVRVDAGPCVIGTPKGAYLTATDSLTTIRNLTASDATNPRLDRVVLEILDPDNGIAGGTRIGQLRVIDGTPSATPGLAALPALAIHLGQILVPANGGTPVVTNNAAFSAAEGAPIPVRSLAERDALPKWGGLLVQRIDLGWVMEMWNGSLWTSADPRVHLSMLIYQTAVSTPNVNWGAGTVAVLNAAVVGAETFQRDQFEFVSNDRVRVVREGVYATNYAVEFFASDGTTPLVTSGHVQLRREGPGATDGHMLGGVSFDGTVGASAAIASVYLPAGGILAYNYMTRVGVTARGRLTLTRIK